MPRHKALGGGPPNYARIAQQPQHPAGAVRAVDVIGRNFGDANKLTPILGRNNFIPCCTEVALLLNAQAIALDIEGAEFGCDADLACPDNYGRVLGIPNATDAQLLATDGAPMDQVVDFHGAHGFQTHGNIGELVTSNLAIPVGDWSVIMAALAAGGFCATLALSAEDLQADDATALDVPSGTPAASMPATFAGWHEGFFRAINGTSPKSLIEWCRWGVWGYSTIDWFWARFFAGQRITLPNQFQAIPLADLMSDPAYRAAA